MARIDEMNAGYEKTQSFSDEDVLYAIDLYRRGEQMIRELGYSYHCLILDVVSNRAAFEGMARARGLKVDA